MSDRAEDQKKPPPQRRALFAARLFTERRGKDTILVGRLGGLLIRIVPRARTVSDDSAAVLLLGQRLSEDDALWELVAREEAEWK